jgi:hypothetical protein
MRLLHLLAAGVLAPITALALPSDHARAFFRQYKRENLCNLKSPPSLCQPNSSVTAAETALRAYQFYRAFVVDGDPRTMFSLIDEDYIVCHLPTTKQCRVVENICGMWKKGDSADECNMQQHHPGYNSGPQTIWSLFCNGNKIATEASSAWCFDASTNMSYARYSTTDRWRWVDGCVHEHVSLLCRALGNSWNVTW